MQNIIGIISILFLVSMLLYLGKTTKEFNFRKHTISHLGIFSKTKHIFLITLLLYALLRLVYFIFLFAYLSLWNNFLIVSSFTIAYTSFILTAVITLSVHENVHHISAMISAFFTVILIFFLGIHLLHVSLLLGIANIILANSMLWGSWIVQAKKGANSYFQMFYAGNVIIWDSLMTLFLFKILK